LFTITLLSISSAQGIFGIQADTEDSKAMAYAHFLIGSLSSLDSNSQDALAHFQAAAQHDPKSPTLALKQAEELINLGKIAEAKIILQRIQNAEAKVADYQLVVARVASQEADVEGSLKALDQATNLYLKEKNSSKAREALLTKVALLADYKRYKESVSTLQNYLKRQPDDEISYYFLGKIHSIFQNRREAKRAYEKSLELRPNFLAAAKALGLQLELEGKVQEALAQYQQVFRTNPTDEELNRHRHVGREEHGQRDIPGPFLDRNRKILRFLTGYCDLVPIYSPEKSRKLPLR
jgi:tetratricopeptide (TPR) repeat protein